MHAAVESLPYTLASNPSLEATRSGRPGLAAPGPMGYSPPAASPVLPPRAASAQTLGLTCVTNVAPSDAERRQRARAMVLYRR